MLLGWNFGDGHLHHEQLLAAVQAECGFEPGDLRVLILESQPVGQALAALAGGRRGRRPRQAEGRIVVADLLDHQPWPEAGSIDLGRTTS